MLNGALCGLAARGTRRAMLSPGVGRRLSMLLAPAEQALRARQRSALQELEHTLVRMDASEADTTTLRESITVLDSLFLCCVLGEFNAGKSALLNALLGGNHCGEGVLPTTAAITLIKHPSVPFEPSHAQSEVEVLDIPRSWLRGLHLVDTPGTNSIEDAHTALTQVAYPSPSPSPNPNPDPDPNPSPNPKPDPNPNPNPSPNPNPNPNPKTQQRLFDVLCLLVPSP